MDTGEMREGRVRGEEEEEEEEAEAETRERGDRRSGSRGGERRERGEKTTAVAARAAMESEEMRAVASGGDERVEGVDLRTTEDCVIPSAPLVSCICFCNGRTGIISG